MNTGRDALAAAAWLNVVMMMLGLSILAVPAMAPAIAADLDISTQLLGAYTALMWLASIVTSVAAGRLINRGGALRVSQLCLAVAALGLLAGSSGPLLGLAVAAIMIGLGQGAETPASSALLVGITPAPQRTLIISIKQTGGQIGGMLAGLFFPFMAGWIGWRGALLAMVPAVVALALLLEWPRRRFAPTPERQHHRPRTSFAQAVRLIAGDGRLLRLSISCMLYVAVQVCQQAFLVSYLVAECSLSLALGGSLLALTQVGGLLGRIFWGAIAGRGIGAIAALVLTGAGMALCALVLGTWGAVMPLPGLAALCFAFGMTSAGWVGVHIAETARLVPIESVGQVTGAMLTMGVAGLILGPLAFAALAAVTTFGQSYSAAGLVALLGVIALTTPPRLTRRS
jgi:predicted MFS family arabinose efflux permease